MADHSTERLLARREERRRQLRRRRLAAAGGLVLGLAAVVAVVAVLLGGGEDSNPGSGRTSSRIARTNANSTEKARRGPPPALSQNATPQPDWGPHTGPVPILEWHVLGVPEPGVAYPELYVSRADFRHQMDWLDRNGFEAVTIEQVEGAWWHGGTLPPKPVVLSFDDGYRPQFTFALPQLRLHGWAGVLNLKAEGSDLYTSNVEAMIDAGWELASHTIDHSDLTTLSGAELEREVAESRRILRHEYGVPAGHQQRACRTAILPARHNVFSRFRTSFSSALKIRPVAARLSADTNRLLSSVLSSDIIDSIETWNCERDLELRTRLGTANETWNCERDLELRICLISWCAESMTRSSARSRSARGRMAAAPKPNIAQS